MNKLVDAIKEYEPSKAFGFYAFWAVFPKRRGSNPRALAEKKYLLAIKNGADPEHLVSSAQRYRDELKAQGKLDTEFVCMASTWLNQKRWIDYAPDPENKERQAKREAIAIAKGWRWNGERWEQELHKA